MKFSTRTRYGLRAVLVLASRFGQGSLPVSQIAKNQGISVAYLEQILNSLKRKGLVKSVRGPQGGYALTKKPSEIPLDHLFGMLNGREPVEENSKTTSGHGADEVQIANEFFWMKFYSLIEKGLSEMTLKSLLDEARRHKKSKPGASHYPFNI
ncbi:MAG: Rrf2 family transcriptional regulator [Candidatus Omnitrophica bacterium]|nr:Rrf2 family transcriptional regulator [Candidatus Omnitrophota bacterium]